MKKSIKCSEKKSIKVGANIQVYLDKISKKSHVLPAKENKTLFSLVGYQIQDS